MGQLDAGRPRFEASREQRDALAREFFAAAERGDVQGLVRLLANDVVFYGDGGGTATAGRIDVALGRAKIWQQLTSLFPTVSATSS